MILERTRAALPGGVHISNGELVVDIPEGQGKQFL